jgi:hypothetical protein
MLKEDLRFHGRLFSVPLECTMSMEGRAPLPGQLSNIAHGGALLQVPSLLPVGSKGRVTVHCDGTDYRFHAEIVRSSQGRGEKFSCALRWHLEGTDREHLQSLFDHLLHQPGGGSRKYPRVERRFPAACYVGERIPVEVVCISRGGLACVGDHPMIPGGDLEVELLAPALPRPLRFQAQVVYVRELADSQFRVGMKFLGGARSAVQHLNDFIKVLLEGRDR